MFGYFFVVRLPKIHPSDETTIKTVYIAEYYYFSMVGNIMQNRITKANKKWQRQQQKQFLNFKNYIYEADNYSSEFCLTVNIILVGSNV